MIRPMAGDSPLTVTLTPEYQKYVRAKLRSGLYASASAVLREALRLIRGRDRLLEARLGRMRREIAHGYAQAKRGQLVDGDKVFEEIRRKSRVGRTRLKRA
jgi:antitoxin ParD1/3/4